MRNEQIVDEATEWFLRLREGETGYALRRELAAWLRESPEHVRAYLEVAATWVDAAQVRAERVGSTQELVERASHADNVVPLADSESQDSPARRWPHETAGARRSRLRFRALAAAALGAAVLGAVLAWWQVSRPATFVTGIGEQRFITLADRSRVQLNSQSEIRVRFTARGRAVELLRGQALFTVEKEAARPFVVHSGSTTVRALGTAFDIYRKRKGTVITVVEGRVAVLEQAGPLDLRPAKADAQTLLSAGQQVVVAARGSSGKLARPAPRSVDVGAATAWTEHQLVFESTPLSEVVDEFNRYNARPLLLQEESAENFRISAVFPSTDPQPLIRFLRAQPGLMVRETANGIVITRQE